METQCKDCERDENCAGNDSGISPCPDFIQSGKCTLVKNNVILVPHVPGEPPSWVPPLPGAKIYWINRKLFDKLLELRYKKPCDICPDEIKKDCEVCAQP